MTRTSLQDESHYVAPLPSPSEPAQQPVPEYHDAAARAPASAAAQGNEGDFRSSADAIIGPAPTGVSRYAFLLLDLQEPRVMHDTPHVYDPTVCSAVVGERL
jgi:hypothetical protein